MNKRDLLGSWALWSACSYRKAGIIAAAVTVVLSLGFLRLDMEMTFYSMMPQSSDKVADLERITDNFPFASQIILVVGHEGGSDTQTVKRAIDALVAEFEKPEYEEYIEGIYASVDRSFLKQHGLMLLDSDKLARFTETYTNLNLTPLLASINDELEHEYTGNADNLADDELVAVTEFRSLEALLGLIDEAAGGITPDRGGVDETVEAYLLGEPYFLSKDESMGLLFLMPSFTMNDFLNLGVISDLELKAKEIAAAEGTSAGMTGMIVVGKDEMETSEQGLGASMSIAFILIIALMVLAFRMYSAPLLAGVPLLVGIIWTAGAAGLFIGRLNIMTAMYMVALLGLGIDYAIHIFSAYIQGRDDGLDWLDALKAAYQISVPGIVTGALTTAAAFFALAFARTEIMRELGIIAGLGILCEAAAMLLLIPPLLGRRHIALEKKGKPDSISRKKVRIKSSLTGRLGRLVSAHPGLFVLMLLSAGILLAFAAPGVEIEDNLMKMEAKGLESIELQDQLVEEFGMAPDGMFILGNDLAELETLSEKIEELETVASVDSVSDYLPSESVQRARAALIDQYKLLLADRGTPEEEIEPYLLLDEIFRLEMNLVELGDLAYLGNMERLSPVLNEITGINNEGAKYRESVFDRLASSLDIETAGEALYLLQEEVDSAMGSMLESMADSSQIHQEKLPAMIRDSFISRQGDEYLLAVNAEENPWDGEKRKAFRDQLETVTDRATGLILVADQLTYMATTDGVRSSIIALIVVGLILLADFRNLKLTLLTFLPLLLSFAGLFGIMALTGIKFDFINIIAIPLLIGIGIDDAVHINHRYRLEGRGKMDRVIERTGTAVLLTTVTTIIGFASFIPSIMRAMRSTGIVLSIAMALAFLYSILFHPALLIIIHERFGASIDPRRKKEQK